MINTNYRLRRSLFLAAGLVFYASNASATCTTEALYQHLNFCKTDTGFNEGALCAAGILDIPTGLGAVAGNTIKRNFVMQLTIAAAKADQDAIALEATVCCQAHNDDARQCILERPKETLDWLKSQ